MRLLPRLSVPVAGLLTLLVAGHLEAQQRSLIIQHFDADVHVLVTGDIDVNETIRAKFTGSWNGIYRDLSLEHQTAQGRRARLDVDLLGVTDDAGHPLRHASSRKGLWTRRWKVWVPDAHDATRTIRIHYVVHNAIRFFQAGSRTGAMDELYWNATGNQWEVPIQEATAEITLPAGVTPRQSAAYMGPTGSTERAVAATRGNAVTFRATRALSPGEGLTVAVGWPPGVVARPSAGSEMVRMANAEWPLALPLVFLVYGFAAWRRNGRDPKRHAIVVQYEPPDHLTPGELGTLVDNEVDMQDLTATLVDLAVRGYVHIEKRTEKKLLGLSHETDYVFHLKKPVADWNSLAAHEQIYLHGLFDDAAGAATPLPASGGLHLALLHHSQPTPPDPGAGAGAGAGPTYGSVALSSLKNHFYANIPGIHRAIYAELISRGYYKKAPEAVKNSWRARALLVALVGGVGGIWLVNNLLVSLDPIAVGVAAGVSGAILFLFGLIMPARTVQGARTREAGLGFKEFLDRVDEDRFKRMITSPDMFEKFLPFAMAFKVEQRWAKAFEGICTEPPTWYSGYGGGTFSVGSFGHDLGAMSSAAGGTMGSSPSGSGGGGSSGGGSGGGGGGGF